MTSVVQQEQAGGNTVLAKQVDFGYNEDSQFSTIDRYASADTSAPISHTDYTYDHAGRVTAITDSDTAQLGSPVVAAYAYTYDNAGNLTSVESYSDTSPSANPDPTKPATWASVSYTYDKTDQLQTATYSKGNWISPGASRATRITRSTPTETARRPTARTTPLRRTTN